MKKAHLITAGLLALAAIAAAQATTAAQSFIRVLEVAGEVQVAAKDRSLTDVVTWVGELGANSSTGPQQAAWTCPQGCKARLDFVVTHGYGNAELRLVRGGVDVLLCGTAILDDAYFESGRTTLGQPVLEAGDQLVWRNNYAGTALQTFQYWVNLAVVAD